MPSYVVASTEEIPEGSRKLVKVRGREIAVFNVKGEYFALLNRCPHEGASLVCGVLVGLVESKEPGDFTYSRPGELLRCPWHGWEYDVRTGQSYCDPDDMKIKSYAVAVAPGERIVKGPYVAETFSVSVDGNYVVVEA
jgi:3-phenylpropionate/trans-cinnamate dioxygenase ferredoxin subunit